MPAQNHPDDDRGAAAAWRALLGLTLPEPHAPGADVGWDHLIDIAERHKSLLLLARGVEKLGVEITSEAARRKLATLRTRSSARALGLARETVRISGALDAAGVPVTTLKGAALSVAIYGDVALRGPGDIDILTPPDKIEKTAEVLCSLGYDCEHLGLLRSSRMRKRLLRFSKDLYFSHPERRIHLECHWRLHPHSVGMLFDVHPSRTEKAPAFGGAALATLGSADNFIYLCFHGAQHLWQRLKWLNDIRWTVQEPRLIDGDWELVAERARDLRMTSVVASAILLVQRLDGVAPPPAMQKLIDGNPRARRDADKFAALLERTAGLADDPHLTTLQCQRRFLDVARAAAPDDHGLLDSAPGFLKPSLRDLRALDLPESMGWAYPMVRFYRIARREVFQGVSSESGTRVR